MKNRDLVNILKSKISSDDKKRILEKEISKPSTGKVVAGLFIATLAAAGITKVVVDKIKEKRMQKTIEEQEEAEFWDDYYENYGCEVNDLDEYGFEEEFDDDEYLERKLEQED